jgi:hypothetical protein
MLTKEQVLALKPGREMDALIAEHVFKWRKIPGPRTDYDGPCESFEVLVPPDIDNPFPLYPPRGAIKPWWFCHKWSIELEDAFEIVREYGLKKADGLELRQCHGCFMARFSGPYWGLGEYPPEAICKAALLAEMSEAVIWNE